MNGKNGSVYLNFVKALLLICVFLPSCCCYNKTADGFFRSRGDVEYIPGKLIRRKEKEGICG